MWSLPSLRRKTVFEPPPAVVNNTLQRSVGTDAGIEPEMPSASQWTVKPKRNPGAMLGRTKVGIASIMLGALLLSSCASLRHGSGPGENIGPVNFDPAIVAVDSLGVPTSEQFLNAKANIPARDAWRVERRQGGMEAALLENSTPPMAMFPGTGKAIQTVKGHYKNGIAPEWRVSRIGTDGYLGVMFLLPTSGHEGQANMRKWAQENKHTVWMEESDGDEQLIVDHFAANGRMVTPAAAVIKLEPGWNEINFDPARGFTAGTAGFTSGRVIKIFWDGT